MKELIEKIESLISDTETNIENLYDDKNCYSPRHYNAIDIKIECEKEHLESLNNFLKEIQEQESKSFEPIECGFDVDYYDNEEIRYTKRNKKTSTSINYGKDNQTYFISNYIFNNPAFLYEVKNIKIPNHRQGVELLRNLGVIE